MFQVRADLLVGAFGVTGDPFQLLLDLRVVVISKWSVEYVCQLKWSYLIRFLL